MAEAKAVFSIAEREQIIAGEELYFDRVRCLGYHGAEGVRIGGVAPLLNHNEWVLGSAEQLIAILLQGLTGPVTVNGKHYKLPGDMPGLAIDDSFSASDIAALASYLRNAWDNQGSVVSVQDAVRVREGTKGRSDPFTTRERQDTQFQ